MRIARIVAVLALAALGAVAGVAQDVKTCLAQYEKDLTALAEERQATITSLSEVYADNLESLFVPTGAWRSWRTRWRSGAGPTRPRTRAWLGRH
jgi:hypothetical protein